MIDIYKIVIGLYLVTIQLIAQDNYFCYYNPDSPLCSSSTNFTVDNEMKKKILFNNRIYVKNIMFFTDNIERFENELRDEKELVFATGSKKEIVEQSFFSSVNQPMVYKNQDIALGNNLYSPLKKEKSYFIAIASLTNIDANMLLLPLYIRVSDRITIGTSIGYLQNKVASTDGFSDTEFMFSVKLLESYWGDLYSSYHLLLPTGDINKAIGNGVYINSLKITYTRSFSEISSRILFSYTKQWQLDIHFPLVEANEFIEEGDNIIYTFSYMYKLNQDIEFLSKYLQMEQKDSFIDGINQRNGAIYRDLNIGIKLNLAKTFNTKWRILSNVSSHINIVYPLSTTYLDEDFDTNPRELMYGFSLEKLF